MKRILLPLLVVSLFACSSSQDETDSTSLDTTTLSDSTTSFPVKPLQILSNKEAGFGADLRLSFTKTSPGYRSIVYKVNSIYENENIGFEMWVPINGFAKLTFKSTGANSDNFIQLLSRLYKEKIDTSQKFINVTTADCIDMGGYIDSLNEQDSSNYTTPAQYKLFLRDNKEGYYAELYLEINENEHWIEIGEKDTENRPSVIALLSKK
jgi:hypothetical protein